MGIVENKSSKSVNFSIEKNRPSKHHIPPANHHNFTSKNHAEKPLFYKYPRKKRITSLNKKSLSNPPLPTRRTPFNRESPTGPLPKQRIAFLESQRKGISNEYT